MVTLEAIARERSFSAAALSLGYTQSAISGQMTRLEEVIGTKLFRRLPGSKGVELTPEGAILLEHVLTITDRVQAARADLEAMKRGGCDSHTLRIGTFPSLSATLLPKVLTRLASASKPVGVKLSEDSCGSSVMRAVEGGELDAAFTTLPLPPGPFKSVELFQDPYFLVVSPENVHGSEPAPVSLSRLRELPVVAQLYGGPQQFVEDGLRADSVELNVVARVDTWASMFALVEAGAGFGFVPALSLSTAPAALRIIALEPHAPQRTVVLAWHAHRLQTVGLDELVRMASSAATKFCPMQGALEGVEAMTSAPVAI